MTRASKFPSASAPLFSDAQPIAPPGGVYLANIDGASRGNPGPAAYAVVMRDPDGGVVLELAKNLGRTTNNVAEYYALLAALDYATSQRIAALRIRSDSELLVRQVQGRYKVKSRDLQPLHERAQKLIRQLTYFAIEHVRREMNQDADALANVALDSGNVAPPRFAPTASTVARQAAPPDGPPRAQTPGARRIRARLVKGALIPLEPLDLPENSEIILDIRIPQ
jgi:ribonuclease HI